MNKSEKLILELQESLGNEYNLNNYKIELSQLLKIYLLTNYELLVLQSSSPQKFLPSCKKCIFHEQETYPFIYLWSNDGTLTSRPNCYFIDKHIKFFGKKTNKRVDKEEKNDILRNFPCKQYSTLLKYALDKELK